MSLKLLNEIEKLSKRLQSRKQGPVAIGIHSGQCTAGGCWPANASLLPLG